MIASSKALALIPDQLSATDAAPLMCAGITTYNALRNSGAHVGDVVAILGVGGLGHLGIQFADLFRHEWNLLQQGHVNWDGMFIPWQLYMMS